MKYYELYQFGPEAFVVGILFSLVTTLISYGAFPLIFAKAQKKPIREKRYILICFGVNFLIKAFFLAVEGNTAMSPYFLWTWVFSEWGKVLLRRKGLLINDKNAHYFSGNRTTEGVENFRESEETVVEVGAMDCDEKTQAILSENMTRFCRKCGYPLSEDGRFCRKCGTEIIER